MTYLYSAERETEDARTQARRRLQQRRCLVCGARDLVNRSTSYFCELHIDSWRFCSICEVLRTTEEHGTSSTCRSCHGAGALARYHADPDRTIYRIRLRQIAERRSTRGDQIFEGVRRRIALAGLVAATPGWSWPRRAALFGGDATALADAYRRQNSDRLRDVDATDRARDAHWSKR